MPREYEREALSRVPARAQVREEKNVERTANTQALQPDRIAEAGKKGAPMQLPFLAELEHSLGADLKGIRAYGGKDAESASERLDADAYTHRGEVVLGPRADKRVVAEEAAHALQQTNVRSQQQSSGLTGYDSAAEVEARGVADSVLAGVTAAPLSVGLGQESIARAKGSSKNSKHANERKREEAERKYNEAKAQLDALKAKPNKTPEDKAELEKLTRQVKHFKQQMDFTGEHHSQNAKGNG